MQLDKFAGTHTATYWLGGGTGFMYVLLFLLGKKSVFLLQLSGEFLQECTFTCKMGVNEKIGFG
jgi:hypothetical protein